MSEIKCPEITRNGVTEKREEIDSVKEEALSRNQGSKSRQRESLFKWKENKKTGEQENDWIRETAWI